jgi:hypothetical protein
LGVLAVDVVETRLSGFAAKPRFLESYWSMSLSFSGRWRRFPPARVSPYTRTSARLLHLERDSSEFPVVAWVVVCSLSPVRHGVQLLCVDVLLSIPL